jgi:DNA-binding CsgD family transcriptional regulator
MAVIDVSILHAAWQDKLFVRPPSENARKYLKPSILTAWDIIMVVRSRYGVNTETIGKELNLHQNTIAIYCRWLRCHCLIDYEPSDLQGEPIIYYPKTAQLNLPNAF